jgi:hypothetical protein
MTHLAVEIKEVLGNFDHKHTITKNFRSCHLIAP